MSQKDTPSKPHTQAAAQKKADAKLQRLSKALKANLQRRKAVIKPKSDAS